MFLAGCGKQCHLINAASRSSNNIAIIPSMFLASISVPGIIIVKIAQLRSTIMSAVILLLLVGNLQRIPFITRKHLQENGFPHHTKVVESITGGHCQQEGRYASYHTERRILNHIQVATHYTKVVTERVQSVAISIRKSTMRKFFSE